MKLYNLTSVRYQSSSKKQPLINITPISIGVSVVISAALYGLYVWLEQGKQLLKSEQRISALAESGVGSLNWSLTDQHGKRRLFSDFTGQWLMLYFGFSHCPDICPEELEKLMKVVQGISKSSISVNVQPVFITLDPDRDTVDYMHKYCKDFENLIGFTGSMDEISEVAKSYRVYFGIGEKDSDGDYIVDHTICMYLIDPKGQVVDVYERRYDAESIVKGSLQHIKDYAKLKKKYAEKS